MSSQSDRMFRLSTVFGTYLGTQLNAFGTDLCVPCKSMGRKSIWTCVSHPVITSSPSSTPSSQAYSLISSLPSSELLIPSWVLLAGLGTSGLTEWGLGTIVCPCFLQLSGSQYPSWFLPPFYDMQSIPSRDQATPRILPGQKPTNLSLVICGYLSNLLHLSICFHPLVLVSLGLVYLPAPRRGVTSHLSTDKQGTASSPAYWRHLALTS